jgi:O-antigen/teichoic acid export membrane protein
VFSLGLAIVQSLDFVGAALGVSLVVHAAGAAEDGARMARVVFARTAVIVGGGAVVLVLLSPFVLGLLDRRYLQLHGVIVITLLAFGSVTRCAYVIWAALQRSRRRMRALMTFNAVAASLVLIAIAPVAQRWGAVGAAALVAGANLLLSLCAAGHVAAGHLAAGRRAEAPG